MEHVKDKRDNNRGYSDFAKKREKAVHDFLVSFDINNTEIGMDSEVEIETEKAKDNNKESNKELVKFNDLSEDSNVSKIAKVKSESGKMNEKANELK